MKKLIGLFWTFFKLGLFTFGGGYAMIPQIKEQVIETDEEAIEAIKKIVEKAKANEVGVEIEEFGFDNMYQFVIRIEKEEKEDK